MTNAPVVTSSLDSDYTKPAALPLRISSVTTLAARAATHPQAGRASSHLGSKNELDPAQRMVPAPPMRLLLLKGRECNSLRPLQHRYPRLQSLENLLASCNSAFGRPGFERGWNGVPEISCELVCAEMSKALALFLERVEGLEGSRESLSEAESGEVRGEDEKLRETGLH